MQCSLSSEQYCRDNVANKVDKVEFLSWMVKIKTHQVLLQTPLDILKSDIATWTDSLSQPTKDQQEKNN